MAKQYTLCFVDDDPKEIARFKTTFGDAFIIGAGTNRQAAEADCRQQGIQKPDLYVLDMYFPTPNSAGETVDSADAVTTARADFLQAQAAFRSVLDRLGQSAQGGFTLAQSLPQPANFVFFSRKAITEDVIEALHRGARTVIKKPDPSEDQLRASQGDIHAAYDSALASQKEAVVRDLERVIQQSHWWRQHREALLAALVSATVALIMGFLLGLIAHGA